MCLHCFVSRVKLTKQRVNRPLGQLEMAALLRGVRAGRALRGLAGGKTGRLSCCPLMLTTARRGFIPVSSTLVVLCCKSGNEPMLTLALRVRACHLSEKVIIKGRHYVGCGFKS